MGTDEAPMSADDMLAIISAARRHIEHHQTIIKLAVAALEDPFLPDDKRVVHAYRYLKMARCLK
jgi:hypothetical protein